MTLVETIAKRKRKALAWALETGAARPILDSYWRARHAGDAELTAFNAACEVAKARGRPTGELEPTVGALLDWARLGRLLLQRRVHDDGVIGRRLLQLKRFLCSALEPALDVGRRHQEDRKRCFVATLL